MVRHRGGSGRGNEPRDVSESRGVGLSTTDAPFLGISRDEASNSLTWMYSSQGNVMAGFRGHDGRGLSGITSGEEILPDGGPRPQYETSPVATLNGDDPAAMGGTHRQPSPAVAAGGEASQLSPFQSDQVPSFIQQASASAEGGREYKP